MAKHEVPAFDFVSIKWRKWFTYDQYKAAFDAYAWPPEHGKPPFPTTTFLDGRKIAGKVGSYPKLNIHYHWTASQVCCASLVFAQVH